MSFHLDSQQMRAQPLGQELKVLHLNVKGDLGINVPAYLPKTADKNQNEVTTLKLAINSDTWKEKWVGEERCAV